MKNVSGSEQNVQFKEQNISATKGTILKDATKNIVMRHLSSFQDHDIETLISDYTNESVLITREATYTGPEEIKIFFLDLLKHFPKQRSNFVLDKLVVHDRLAFIVWHANTPSLDVSLGTDTFIIKHDKICEQTFAGQMKFVD